MNLTGPCRGYSLVEMLVAMSIFAVITGMVIANFGQGRRSDEMRFSTQFVATVIRRAQTNALAGVTLSYCRDDAGLGSKPCQREVDCQSPATCVSDVPNGWGAHITTISPDDTKIILFADLNGDGRYQPVESINRNPVSPGVAVSVVGVSPGLSSALDIVFVPPKPEMLINGAKDDNVAVIEVGTVDGMRRRITVNRVSGQVSPD